MLDQKDDGKVFQLRFSQGLVAEYGMNRKLSSTKRIDSNVDSLKEGETEVGR